MKGEKTTVDQARRRRQMVGAFGEKRVEAELLRHGWSTANANMGVKNAADFDIFAQKQNPSISINIRVKACGVGVNSFAFNFRPGSEIKTSGLDKNDFTVFVAMGKAPSGDTFYVVPTKIVRAHLAKYRRKYLITPNRDDGPRKDMGRWDLRLATQRANPLGSGFAKKWSKYLDNWNRLEHHK